jgi:hypothetical protein
VSAPPPARPGAAPSVAEADPTTLAWEALADELTPAKSLARIDTVTARVVTNVALVGSILTGLGLLTAGSPAITGAARGLALAAVVAAVLAVGCALAGQVLTIRAGVNIRNLAVLKGWYRDQFRRRAYPTRAATILLIAAILLAGAAAATALLQPPQHRPVIALSETATAPGATAGTSGGGLGATVLVEVTFHALDPGDTLILTVTSGTAVVARAAVTPQPDGTASRKVTVPGLLAGTAVEVVASAGGQKCLARLGPDVGSRPVISCQG